MSRGQRESFPGAYYHVMSRGNEKQDIFNNASDKEKFLGYLKSAVINYRAVIHCYCLMQNHFHLLIETPEGNISRIMQYIIGSYSKYFNSKWKRTGHLFQNRYKSIIVHDDQYFLELSRYIHLNPTKAGYVPKPEQYKWSSYQDYIELRASETMWLKKKFLMETVSQPNHADPKTYRQFVEDRLGKDYDVKLFENI